METINEPSVEHANRSRSPFFNGNITQKEKNHDDRKHLCAPIIPFSAPIYQETPLQASIYSESQNASSSLDEGQRISNSSIPKISLHSPSFIPKSPFNLPPLFSSRSSIHRDGYSRYDYLPNEYPYRQENRRNEDKDPFSAIPFKIKDIRLTRTKYTYLFEVQFKRQSRLCIGSEDDACIDIGDYVSVTGDRGIDMGKVISRKQLLHMPVLNTYSIVLNKASLVELSLLREQRREEKDAVKLCTQKARQQNLDIVIVDAEFQYDRKKLTVYYYCNSRIDFRTFVKELYGLYYARIWMENIKNQLH